MGRGSLRVRFAKLEVLEDLDTGVRRRYKIGAFELRRTPVLSFHRPDEVNI